MHFPERAREALHKLSITVLVTLPLCGLVAAMVFAWQKVFFPRDLLILLFFHTIASMGITVGYHRMLTHQGFTAPAWLRLILLICGAMAFEGSPAVWAATHIKHHAHSDEEGDPHSPLEGFWHAHLGWLFSRTNFPQVRTYAPHLLQDPVVVFVSRTSFVWMALSLFIPYLLGGWTAFVWGGLLRVFFTTHITWSVNSVCHTFGKREFETTDASRNHWIVGLLAYGEGWHNNHHAFPRNAFHGMHWWQVDLSGLFIRFCERTGLIAQVQRVTAEAAEAQRLRALQSRTALDALRAQLQQRAEAAQREMERVFETSIASMDDAELKRSMEQYTQSLSEIRRSLSSPLQLKRPRLEGYARTIQKLQEQARQIGRVGISA